MMRLTDVLRYGLQSMLGHRTRTLLMLLAMAIGVGAVVVLTALGEGARRYVLNQFSALGSHMVIVLPGRSETTGAAPPLLGQTPRPLTLDDALALYQSHAVQRVAPLVIGAAPVSWRAREREVTVLGTTAEMEQVRELRLARGKFIATGDPRRGAAVAVIGHQLRRELFGQRQALGEWLRIGEYRFRVIGELAQQGQTLGADISDIIIIPVASAQALFNTESLFRILIQAKGRDSIPRAVAAAERIITERHDGETDITVITQDSVLATFDRIFTALTLAVGGIAAISLAVAGILIMNVMLVAISQRTAEIGLLKALGAPRMEITLLFLAEAGLLSLSGGVAGLAVGTAGTWLLDRTFTTFSIGAPLWASAGGLGVALLTGLVFGYLPARRAARLNPVTALTGRR